MQTHLAESRVQALAGIDVYGSTITTYLEKIGFLGPHLSVAHGVWLDDDDIKRLADHGCSVAHNPGSNLRLGSGIAAVRTMLQAGVNVGIGTDGSNCSDHQNMFEAMRLASFVSRVQGRPVQEWISTEEVGEMAIGGGARMMGLRNHSTQLKAGSLADIVFLDLSSLNFIPFNDPTNQLVHSEDSSAVDSVMIGGRWVFRHRKFQTIDFDSLRRRVEAAVNRLRTDNEPLRKMADGIATYVSSFCAGAVQRPYHISRLSGCGCATQPSGFRVG
ncbi:MAG: amidohydrolase family protein [Pseudolabrys sp.]